MRLVTWNVNGLRSVMDKGFVRFVRETDPDIILLQETKVKPDTLAWDELADFERYWNPAQRPGYSGTGILTKVAPLHVTHGLGPDFPDSEGRVVTMEFAACHVVCVYTPNAQSELARLPYRLQWDVAFLRYLKGLEKHKPVLCAGDLNVAHREIDLARPSSNRGTPGFSDEERASFDAILAAGLLDVFREFDPSPHRYTWWSYRAGARGNNVGWRLDYWLASAALRPHLQACRIHADVMGSDHCPVLLETKSSLLFS
jgi:exodeoxyribonuclease III